MNLREKLEAYSKVSAPPVARGVHNHKTKLTDSQVAYIVNSTKSSRELANEFGVSPQAINWRKKQWQDTAQKESEK